MSGYLITIPFTSKGWPMTHQFGHFFWTFHTTELQSFIMAAKYTRINILLNILTKITLELRNRIFYEKFYVICELW